MIYIPIILFVGLPLISGFCIKYYFWNFSIFKTLKAKAKEFDEEKVLLKDYPADGMSLSKLRKLNELGDKTVVTHHLIFISSDLLDKILDDFCWGTLVVAGVVLFLYVARPIAQQPAVTSVSDWFGHVSNYFAEYWGIPAGELVVILFAFNTVMTVKRQIKRYQDVLNLQ